MLHFNSMNTGIRFVVLFFFFLWMGLSCSDRHPFNVYVNDVFSWSNSSSNSTDGYLHFELLYINNSEDTLYIKDQYVNVDGYLDNENPVLKTTFLCVKEDTLYGNRSYGGEHIHYRKHPKLELKKICPKQRVQVRFTVPKSAIRKLYFRKYSKDYDEKGFLFFVADNAVLVTYVLQNGKLVKKRLSGFSDYMILETIDSEIDMPNDDYEEF